jgi:flagellar protein FlbD
MIFLTRLDGREVVVNSDLIVTVEATPDTMVTLTTGDRLLVKEGVQDVVDRSVAFRYRTLQGPGTSRSADTGFVPPYAERQRRPSGFAHLEQVSDGPVDGQAAGALHPRADRGDK